jgi:hypothetical protein
MVAVFHVSSPDHVTPNSPGPSLVFEDEGRATAVIDFIHRVCPDVRLVVRPFGWDGTVEE